MKRLLSVALVVAVLACSATAGAAATSYSYAGNYYWPAGQAHSSSYSSHWIQNIFYKTSSFDTTLTFIDNVSYGWHSTVRSWATYYETHWLSSQVKKAHCRANTVGRSWAACTVK